jgi:hypothetical protein
MLTCPVAGVGIDDVVRRAGASERWFLVARPNRATAQRTSPRAIADLTRAPISPGPKEGEESCYAQDILPRGRA